MTTYKYIGGNDGLWTDPQSWDTGTVPLWDGGSDVQLGGSSVTLHDIEPNNMTVEAGAASASTNGLITLDNAAFGPGLVVEVTSATPATRATPSSSYSDASAGIRVVGYDTNYGTIEVKHNQNSNGGYFLGFTVEPGSQLNNLGTITADGQISDHSNETHLLFENGPGPFLGVLNNDGQINVFDDTVAYIGLAVIGSGTITIARPDGNFNANFPSFVVPGPVAATQTVEKPGALRRELECLVAEAPVQHCGPDLKHAVGALGRPAHLFALVHAGTHQLIDRALGPRGRDRLASSVACSATARMAGALPHLKCSRVLTCCLI